MTTVNHFVERYQSVLPEGLKIDRELGGAEVYGHEFRVLDSRGDAQCPIVRIARILDDLGGSASWHNPLRDRAQKLLGTSLPYVSTLREIGFSEQAVFVLHDEHPIPLANKIHADEGLPPPVAHRIAEQLLIGLAALHQRDIAHGDLRAGNVFLSESPAAGKFAGNVWISDVITGGLTYWSEGRFRPAKSNCFPPEWNGKIAAPSHKADLYALGLLIAEMLLGREAIRSASEAAQQDKASLWDQLAPRLKKLRTSRDGWNLFFLSRLLLAAEDDRPTDAAAVQRLLCNWRRRNQLIFRATVVSVSLAIIALLATFLVQSRHALDERNGQAISLNKRMSGLERENKGLNDENKRLAEENKRLTDLNGPEGGKEAQTSWQKAIRDSTTYDDDFKKIEELIKPLPANDSKRDTIVGWLKRYRDLCDRTKPWRQSDADLKALVKAFGSAPQDGATSYAQAEARLKVLNHAAQIWRGWVRMPAGTNLHQLIPGHDAIVAEILRNWVDAIVSKQDWTLRPISGTAPANTGNRRVILFDPADSFTWQKIDRAWPDDKRHDYTKNDELLFEWKQGSPIKLAVAYDWSLLTGGITWKYLIPDQQFGGPLAIWLMNNEGQISNGNAALRYEIVDCPGPPRSVAAQVTRLIPGMTGT